MKKLVYTLVSVCAVLIGLKMLPISSAVAQTPPPPIFAVPLTNNSIFALTNVMGFTNTPPGGFTNTVVQPTNLVNLRLSNVVTLLLTLQTNIEITLPVLAILTSNASVAVPSASTQVPTAVVPITSAPSGLFLPPTGQTNGSQQPIISMILGTNVIEIDPATFQGLVLLQNDLQQTLPVLQMLNGTSPGETNAVTPAPATMTPLTNSFTPARRGFFTPRTGRFPPPLTNQSQVLTTPSPF